jgi:hypothetical protein
MIIVCEHVSVKATLKINGFVRNEIAPKTKKSDEFASVC